MIPLSPHHICHLHKCDQINDVLGFWRPQAHVHQRRLSFETSTSSEVLQRHLDILPTAHSLHFPSEELSAEDATHKSFMEKRHRHSSVPQTVKPTGPVQGGGLSFCLFALRSVYYFVLVLHICICFNVCLYRSVYYLFDHLLRRSPPTSTKHPSWQADVCQAEQKPDRQGDTFSLFFSLLSQMAMFVLIISQITSWLILLHSSFHHILTLIFCRRPRTSLGNSVITSM